jgi:hypothetical protein
LAQLFPGAGAAFNWPRESAPCALPPRSGCGKPAHPRFSQSNIEQTRACWHEDFVFLDMFASYCTRREEAKGATKIAERQLQRIYR